ncbi:MAG: PKD domain-containing protein [FCB group bacterium]|jgi:hypothetical protein|nr:PKD domain-containing protein [FCB group bacterium]
MPSFRGITFFALVLAFLNTSTAVAAPYDNPNGSTRVYCLGNPSQSYELYIPLSAPATNRPILYVFDSSGNGKSALIWLTPVAAANGWILAASNNSKNGPWTTIFTAQDAIMQDTEARWNLHPTRRFAAGFSGGARASLALAFRFPEKICGVLCMGAGWPINTELGPSNSSLVVRILIGTEDGNLDYDIPMTQALLTESAVRCEVSTYSGGHIWPQGSVVLSAAQWLNLNAQTDPNEGVVLSSCRAQSLFGQPPQIESNGFGYQLSGTTDLCEGVEDFQGVQEPISRVEWWGMTAGDAWTGFWGWMYVPREPASDIFIISFYADEDGRPGAKVHEETITARRVDGPGLFKNNFLVRHYTADLSTPVSLSSGWVSIQHKAVAVEEHFLWLTSGEGNGISYINRIGYYSGTSFNAVNLAFCLSRAELECSLTATSLPGGALMGKPPYTVNFRSTVVGTTGEDVTWHWDFGDGTTLEGDANPTHTYTVDGNYTVTVTVTTPTRTVTQTLDSVVRVTQALPASSWEAMSIQLVALLCLGGMAAVALKRRPKRQASGPATQSSPVRESSCRYT